MPRFFFHLRSQDGLSADETGTDFPCLEEAYLGTCDAILEMAVEMLRARQNPTKDAFEIADDRGNVLMEVPFSEVLWPGAVTNKPVRSETIRVFESCRRRAERSHVLQAEIRAEFQQARNTFSDIHANLARLAAATAA
jgi:hypothetical protein